MTLVLKGKVTLNSAGTEQYTEFLEATGEYDADTNPGGFGGPNPARNTLAIEYVANHKLVAGDQPASVLPYNPLSVTSFTTAITKAVNGVIQWTILAIPIYDVDLEDSYVDGNVVYDNENVSAPFIKVMVDDEWVPITAAELVGNATVIQLNKYSFPIPDALRLRNELLLDKQSPLRDKVYGENDYQDGEFETADRKYKYVDLLISAGCDAFRAQAYNEAQADIEEIFKYETEMLTANG